MMNKLNLTLGIGVLALALAVIGWYLPQAIPSNNPVNHLVGGYDTTTITNPYLFQDYVTFSSATTTYGSAGTVTYETKGGVSFAYFKVPFVTTATSTPCSVKNPFGASTSTLLQHNVQITNGTSTAGLIFTTASSTTYTATTTKLYTSGTFNVAAATSPSFTISPSNVNAAEIIPNAFITTWVEGYKASGFVYGGYCSGVVSKP